MAVAPHVSIAPHISPAPHVTPHVEPVTVHPSYVHTEETYHPSPVVSPVWMAAHSHGSDTQSQQAVEPSDGGDTVLVASIVIGSVVIVVVIVALAIAFTKRDQYRY